jgi:hypothetical protein
MALCLNNAITMATFTTPPPPPPQQELPHSPFIVFSGNWHMCHGGGARDGAGRLLIELSSKVSPVFVFISILFAA